MMTVLIVEDEEPVVELWRRIMSSVTAREKIRVARSSEEALEKMAIPPPPDLVLLDVRVPRVFGGHEPDNMLYHIQALKALNPAARVLVLTGVSDESLPALAQQLGADGFRPKISAASQDALFGAILETLRSPKPGEPAYARSVELLDKLTEFLSPEAPIA
jgi:DNA-binding NarL/FixJ family response regulator